MIGGAKRIILSDAGTHNRPLSVNNLLISKLLDLVLIPNKNPAPLTSIISSISNCNFLRLFQRYLAFLSTLDKKSSSKIIFNTSMPTEMAK